MVILAVAACASAGTPSSGDSDQTFVVRIRRDPAAISRTLDSSADVVWSELPLAFHDLGYEGGPSIRPGERQFFTPSMLVRGRLYPDAPNSAYLDCGRSPAGGAAADEYEVSFVVIVRVAANPTAGSTLQVAVDGVAQRRAENADAIFCSGTGRIEQMFADAIEQRVRRHRPSK